jgi:hypothetical protein
MRKLYLHSQSMSGFAIICNLAVRSIGSEISLVDPDWVSMLGSQPTCKVGQSQSTVWPIGETRITLIN